MSETDDFLLEAFQKSNDSKFLEEFVEQLQVEANNEEERALMGVNYINMI